MMHLEKLSAMQIGELVNKKILSPVEVVNYFISRAQIFNPSVNAFVYMKEDQAISRAKDMENKIMTGQNVGPLAGVPVAMKDFLPSKKGWTHSYGGVKVFKDCIDEYDSEFTKAAEGMGAIVIGKTNAPSFGFRGVTDNYMYGPTSTPFNTAYNSGGSSGGSAAAVGAGFVPVAEAGDAGGSIRIPAAWCGTFGFKPSAGLVPSVCRPDAWTATHPYCCGGPVSRTVDDAALMISAMQHYDRRDPLSVPLPETDYTLAKTVNGGSLKGMKIACTYDFDLFPAPDLQIAKAVDKAVEILSHEGAVVAPPTFHFKYSKNTYEDAWLTGICIDTALDMEKIYKPAGIDLEKDHKDQLPEEFFKWNEVARNATMLNYRLFHEVRTDILDAHEDIFDRFDIIIAPVTGCMPVKNENKYHDGLVAGPQFINSVEVDPLIGFGYTYLENMIGTPAASVPIAVGEKNLPIGLQIIAPRYRDFDVFRVAYALERVNPWAHKYPFDDKEVWYGVATN